jgi:hypothetical protein
MSIMLLLVVQSFEVGLDLERHDRRRAVGQILLQGFFVNRHVGQSSLIVAWEMSRVGIFGAVDVDVVRVVCLESGAPAVFSAG